MTYLLPAHSMAGLYSYTNRHDYGIYTYMGKCTDIFNKNQQTDFKIVNHFAGYMLLYLMTMQTIALFCAHYFSTKISSTTFLSVLLVILASVGGYMIHPNNLSEYVKWFEIASPQKWTLPILTEYEYSKENLRSTTTLECKNKQVRRLIF